MTILGKLFRTTAFKLSLAYLVVFAIGAGVVLGGVAWNVNALLNSQIGQTVDAEILGLAEQYETGGIRHLVDIVERRTRQPGSSLYLITNFAGQPLAGNIATLPPGVLDSPGLVETPYQRPNDARPGHIALARIFLLQGGFRLLVGRDLEERESLREVMIHALYTSLIWLVLIGTIGGLVVALRVLRRVDAMTASARSIMSGDLTRRLPVAGTGDELDRLAQNLNAMIARIADLMTGLREVSDNIAHDLRTPLTRMRNRAEEALRSGAGEEASREALERIIAEADGLIGIFNALLMIARAEAGTGKEAMRECDLGTILADLVELYEPASEEAGQHLVLDAEPRLTVLASRELLGQALANLIDNALKYGALSDERTADRVPVITISAHRAGGRIEIAVADRGPGIPLEDRARVVERFVRLEGARTRPGSGLGLSLAAAIARLHGGEFRLEDNGPGLRAVIALPVHRPASEPGRSLVPAKASAALPPPAKAAPGHPARGGP